MGAVSLRQDLGVPCAELSLRRQCELVGISRSGFYYEPGVETPENRVLMRRLDELHLEHLVYGSRRLTARLQREGREVNRKRVVRLLRLMGVEAVYPKRSLSQPAEGHRIYPYLLEGLEISGPDQVWCSDITYVPMAYGFMYLVAVESVGVDVSMDGRGRWIDNRFIERLWRSVKQEDIYLQDYSDGLTAQRGLARWFDDYNIRRPHQALGYATPGGLYHSPESYGAKPAAWRWQ